MASRANGTQRDRKSKAKTVSANSFRYVPCTIEPGMFHGELLVHAYAIDPDDPTERIDVQVLVDDWLVANVSGKPERGKPAHGYLRVGLSNVAKGYAVVVLPQPGIPVGESMMVQADSLVSLT